jgi:hypothetical protein
MPARTFSILEPALLDAVMVIQEIALNKTLLVVCGGGIINWNVLSKAISLYGVGSTDLGV